MRCKTCQQEFNDNELCDNECFECFDNASTPDLTVVIKELLENVLQTIADAQQTTAFDLKNKLVAEHAYKNPEQYAKDVLNKIPQKKKADEEPN